MTGATRTTLPDMPRAEAAQASTAEPLGAAEPYTTPDLHLICDVDALLEVLGPAQANYGGNGLGG